GAGKIDRVNRSVTLTAYVVIACMAFFTVLWDLGPELLYSPFTSDPQVMSIGVDYLKIIAIGYIFLGLDFVFGSAFQAAGRTTLQMILNMFRWAITVLIAYVLVGSMGLSGIWWGFPIGNFIGFLAFFAFLKSGFWLRKWKRK
ncbi:MAG: polysaccharide biosynthesis C-terminal domain-containing protein, partial [Candidatus Aenigmarchaeota archaeon]|nr:polysaccharide biosynthesis C-terminal domain-containing protein [Candidatus Aenigmarchaeota archaeon]